MKQITDNGENVGCLVRYIVEFLVTFRAFRVTRDHVLWYTFELLRRERDFALKTLFSTVYKFKPNHLRPPR